MVRILVLLIFLLYCKHSYIFSQAAYLDEVYDDAVEGGYDGATGIIGLLVFAGVAWMFVRIFDSFKEVKNSREEIKRDKEISTKIATAIIEKTPDISKYQYKESWKKGFANATYDISHNRIKNFGEKTVDDLVKEYRHLCEVGRIVQAESVMEQIGYLQKLEFEKKIIRV